MTNYIEYTFLENLVINYITVYQVSTFTKTKSKKTNLVIGVFILSFYSTISYYLNSGVLNNILIKILIISFCIYIIYLPKKIKKYIKLYMYYFLLSFLLVGIVISITLFFNLNISNIITKIFVYIISGIILFLFNKLMWKMWKSKIKKDDLIYVIKIGNVFIPAFVDTGNNVYDYINNLHVIFIEKQFFNKLNEERILEKETNLSINTMAGEDSFKGYVAKDIVFLKNTKEVYKLDKVILVFVDKELNINNEYNALISYDMYVDKLKGVILC